MLSYTHFSLGIMVESGSDLTEKCKALESSCTVRWILDIQAFDMCSELPTSLDCTCGRIDAYISYLKFRPCPLATSPWMIHSLSHLSSWLHQWNCSCSWTWMFAFIIHKLWAWTMEDLSSPGNFIIDDLLVETCLRMIEMVWFWSWSECRYT